MAFPSPPTNVFDETEHCVFTEGAEPKVDYFEFECILSIPLSLLIAEPESFTEGMKAIDEGRVVDMEKALHEQPPA